MSNTTSSRPKDRHWNQLEEDICEIIEYGTKRTKGSGSKKGDMDVKTKIHGVNIFFEGKSEEIPKGNCIVKYDEFQKMLKQAQTFFGIGIYVRKDKDSELIASMKLTDLRRLIDILTG